MSTATPVSKAAEPVLLRDDQDGISTLTLNRPLQYNALSGEMLDALQAALDGIAADDSVRVVVIAGSGKAFCAGHDLKELRSSEDRDFHRDLFRRCSQVMLGLTRIPQPVIARVSGVCTAAGCQMVAQCDLAVAESGARFAVSGINVGLFCATPAVPLSRNLSRKRALQMLFTGEFIDAATALDWGLVNQVVPAAELDGAVLALADRIRSRSPLAVASGKRFFYRQLEAGLEQAYDLAAEAMTCNMDSEDAREGIDAFTARRAPVWRGR